MMQSSKNNQFTARDIERYYSGEMSAPERHALEKAALDDPFLADALEGLTFTSTVNDDLQKIKNRLLQKTGRKKIVPIQKYQWLKIAAVLLVVAGGGLLAYNILSPENKSIAQNTGKENQIVPDQNNISSPTDSIAIQKEQPKIELKKDIAVTQKKKLSKKTILPQKQFTANKEQLQQTVVTAPLRSFKPKQNVNNEFLKNLPEKTNPDSNLQTTGYKNQAASDSDAMNFVALNQKKALKNDTIKNFNVTLKTINLPQSEVVVIGNSAQKKKVGKTIITIDTLEPAEGYTNFNDYIASNLKSPEELEIKPVSGEVQLSFDVNKEGEPVNITVVKSLCHKCDEEAIRLLKEGPKWKKKKNKKGRITIKF